MSGSRFSSITPVSLAPTDLHGDTNRSCLSAPTSRSKINANTWICFWTAIGFTALAVLTILLPQLFLDRAWLQLSGLLIALTGTGLHRVLQVTVFDQPRNDQDDRLQVTIIDLNRLESLR